MPFRKKKPEVPLSIPVPPPPPRPSDGNPGGVPEEPLAPRITEEVILGYGVMRLLEELQGIRQEQLGILAVLEEIKRQEEG